MHFLFPSLAAGFVLVAAPLIVHLINMLRHRRQDWAAMEFLLAAYRKQRKWVVLRQLLLLALRTLAMLILVAMLAGWISGSRLLDALGGNTQHHVVLLDDSFSMEDRSGKAGSAYQTALASLENFAQRLVEDAGNHQVTVLRTSRAALSLRGGQGSADAAADLSGQTLVAGRRDLARLSATSPAPLAVGLDSALEMAADLIEHTAADKTHVYVLTDLRENQWQASRRIGEHITEITRLGADVKLIDCAVNPQPNLSLMELTPLGDVWAAGVPCRVAVKVHNHSDQPVTDLAVSAAVIRYGAGATQRLEQSLSGQIESLPDLVFDRIEGGADSVKVFQIYIDEPGHHAIQVKLPEDVVPADNVRACTLPLVTSRRMLFVQGNPDDPLSYYLRSAIDPGNSIRTGWSVEVRNASFLSAASIQDLAAFDVVWLLDIPTVDAPTAAALRGYVEQGGGLGLWCGSATRVDNYNEFLAGPRGVLPGKLLAASAVRKPAGQGGNELVLDQPHPITAPLEALGPAMFGSVRMQQALGWEPLDQPTPPTILFRLVDQRPLSLVHRVGEGTVLLNLTGLDRSWTNWPSDPTFVVYALRASAELSLGKREPTSYGVGELARLQLDDGLVARTVEWVAPTLPPRAVVELPVANSAAGQKPTVSLDPMMALNPSRLEDASTLVAGVHEVWTTTPDGRPEVFPLALTVDGREGNLARIDRGALLQAIRPATVEILDAAALSERGDSTGSSARVLILLAFLAGVLVAEQAVAYSASYHQRPVVAGGRR